MKSSFAALAIQDSYVTRWRLTGWLGRRDSNLCISESEFGRSARFRGDFTFCPVETGLAGWGAGLELAYLELKARPINA